MRITYNLALVWIFPYNNSWLCYLNDLPNRTELHPICYIRSEDNKLEKQIVKREAKSNNKSKRFNINDVNIKIDAKKIK